MFSHIYATAFPDVCGSYNVMWLISSLFYNSLFCQWIQLLSYGEPWNFSDFQKRFLFLKRFETLGYVIAFLWPLPWASGIHRFINTIPLPTTSTTRQYPFGVLFGTLDKINMSVKNFFQNVPPCISIEESPFCFSLRWIHLTHLTYSIFLLG